MTNQCDKNESDVSHGNFRSLAIDTRSEILPADVKKLMDDGNLTLIDVRTPGEWEKARISGAILIPLAEFATRIKELDSNPARPMVLYCHHGMRSLRAVQLLQQYGLFHAKSMAGGIEGWSLIVDPTVPRY